MLTEDSLKTLASLYIPGQQSERKEIEFKKEIKEKRICMAFADDVYEWLKTEPRKRKTNMSNLVEESVHAYMDALPYMTNILHEDCHTFATTGRPLGCTQGRKGQKAKRATIRFSDDTSTFLKEKSSRQGMTITELVDKILRWQMSAKMGTDIHS